MNRSLALSSPRHATQCAVLAGFLTAVTLGLGQELVVTPDSVNGIFRPDQGVRWTVELRDAETATADFVVRQGGLTEIARGQTPLSAGSGRFQVQGNEPGWLLAEVTARTSDGKTLKALGGALVSPERIRPAQPRPDDFDAFWAAKLGELERVPSDPKITPGDSGKPDIDYGKITLHNIRGTQIQGQVARPAGTHALPAMLIVQWAGVYPLQRAWVTDRAAEGWLALNISAHDLPIDESESFYREATGGPLRDYPSIGNDDRETSYFLRMYLSCFRAAQYLTERPDWDGHTLVVTGGSQGGLQSFVTAALHPKVSAVLACVPAGCDLLGPVAGRKPGWPMWYYQTKDKEEAKVRAAAPYFDVVNFASRVKVPVLVGVGLIDTVCPAPGILAACNQLQGPCEMVTLPLGEHGETKGSHRPYYLRFDAWSRALREGDPAPVAQPGS